MVALLSTTEAGRSLLTNFGRLVGQVLVASFGLLKGALFAVVDTAKLVFDALIGMIPDGVLNAIQWLADKAGVAADAIGDWNEKNEDVGEIATGLVGPVLREVKAIEDLVPPIEDIPPALDNIPPALGGIRKPIDDTKESVELLAGGVTILDGRIKDIETTTKDTINSLIGGQGLMDGFQQAAGGAALASSDIQTTSCLLYTSPSPRDRQKSRMPSSA